MSTPFRCFRDTFKVVGLATLVLMACVPVRAQSGPVPGFSQPAVYPIGNIDPRAIATADFDGDGRPDLAVAAMGADVVIVLTKLGGAAAPSMNSYSAGHSPLSLAAGDFN